MLRPVSGRSWPGFSWISTALLLSPGPEVKAGQYADTGSDRQGSHGRAPHQLRDVTVPGLLERFAEIPGHLFEAVPYRRQQIIEPPGPAVPGPSVSVRDLGMRGLHPS